MSDNLEAVIKGSSTVGLSLWHYFTILHPADIAQFLSDQDRDDAKRLFGKVS